MVAFLSRMYDIDPAQIATIGDMPNDVLMFARSGLSIAMGNASPEVQRAARRVTTANSDDGFANAVERFVVPARAGVGVGATSSGRVATTNRKGGHTDGT